jgi:hypothetical protein
MQLRFIFPGSLDVFIHVLHGDMKQIRRPQH